MRTTRRAAAACAAAGVVLAGLAVGPQGAPSAAAPIPAPVAQPASTEVLVSDLHAIAAKKRTTVRGWSATTYRVTTSASTKAWSFTVRATGPAQRKVQLQQRVGTSWRTIAVGRTGTTRSRAFAVRLTVPQGTTVARLLLPATKTFRSAATPAKTFVLTTPGAPPVDPPADPPPPVDPPADPPSPPATSSTHYSFLDGTAITSAANAPRWNRCTTIRWAADFTRATAGNGLDRTAEKARWEAVFAAVSAATGYAFQYVDLPDGAGTITAGGDITGFGARTGGYANADVVVTYASDTDTGAYKAADLAGNVIGYGGPMWSISSAGKRIVAGEVLIDYADVTRLSLDSGDLTSLYLHEFGHALGLGHYSDTAQVMNPYVTNPPVTAYADGDRSGLYALASQTCFTGGGLALLGARTVR